MKPSKAVLDSWPLRLVPLAALLALGGVWLVIRFVGLQAAPHGFWMDEAWDAVQVMCLAEHGRDADGQSWPLISNGLGGGSLPITWTAQMVAWTRVFGTSIAGFRSLAAFWVVLTCAGLFAIGRALLDLVPARQPNTEPQAAANAFPWLACFAGLLSPWSFQFSRMSWEQPLAPLFLVWALYALIRLRANGRMHWALICGVSGACSMITYPPLRVAVPCVLGYTGLVLLASKTPSMSQRKFALRLAIAATALALTFLPVALRLAAGSDRKRMMYVSIFSPDWLNAHRGQMGSLRFFIQTLADNLWIHLRPSYLFGVGDPNLRHSAHIVGQLSPIDTLAVILTLVGLGWAATLTYRQLSGHTALRWPRLDGGEQVLVLVAVSSVVGGLFATLPCALTWEGLPHALRAIGAWPFVSLFTGAALSIAWARLRWLPALTAIVAIAYSAYFLPEYFRVYGNVDPGVYYRDISEAVESGKRAGSREAVLRRLRPFVRRYRQEVLRYYLMHDGGLSCSESLETYAKMGGNPRRSD